MSVTHTLPSSLPTPFAHLEQRFGFGDAAATWWRTFGKLADADLSVYHRALCNSATEPQTRPGSFGMLQWRLLQRQAPYPRRRKYVRSGLVLHPGVASDCAEHSFVGRQGHGDDDGDVGDDDDDGDFDDDHVDDDEDDEVEECDLACRTVPYRTALRRLLLRRAARVRGAAEAATRRRTRRRPLPEHGAVQRWAFSLPSRCSRTALLSAIFFGMGVPGLMHDVMIQQTLLQKSAAIKR